VELKLHGIGDAGSLWKGVQGIGEAGRERSELTLYLQVAGRVVGGDLEALFASSGNRAELLVDRPHADGTLRDLVGLDDGVVPAGTFSKWERNANTSSIGLLITTVFSKVATSRSFLTPSASSPSQDLLASSGAPSFGYLLFSFVGKPGLQHIGA
jgi:hypothetical protein